MFEICSKKRGKSGLTLGEGQKVGFDGAGLLQAEVPGLPGWAQGPAFPGSMAQGELGSTHLWLHFSAALIATDFYKTLSSKGEISVTGTVFFMGKDSVGWISQ